MLDKDSAEKIIIEMRNNGALQGEILDAIFPDHNGSKQKENKVKHMIESLRVRGLIEKRGRGNTNKLFRKGKPVNLNSEKYHEPVEYKKKPKCGYPRCRTAPTKEFAKVMLCENHHTLIWEETVYFYEGEDQSEYKERRHFLKIAHLIPHRYKGDEVSAKTRTISKPKKVKV